MLATNPCRCGYLADEAQACSRAPRCGLDYQAKISGPLYDRIDLFVDVPAVSASDLALPADGEASAAVAARVSEARALQQERYRETDTSARYNAAADGQLLERIVLLEPEAQALLRRAADHFRLTARAYHRVMRVARTIADLAGSEPTRTDHIAEAISYRRNGG